MISTMSSLEQSTSPLIATMKSPTDMIILRYSGECPCCRRVGWKTHVSWTCQRIRDLLCGKWLGKNSEQSTLFSQKCDLSRYINHYNCNTFCRFLARMIPSTLLAKGSWTVLMELSPTTEIPPTVLVSNAVTTLPKKFRGFVCTHSITRDRS